MNTPAPASVLIVDDNPANLLALEAVLAPQSLNIVKAGSGEDALRWVLRQAFDLVILDVMMPVRPHTGVWFTSSKGPSCSWCR